MPSSVNLSSKKEQKTLTTSPQNVSKREESDELEMVERELFEPLEHMLDLIESRLAAVANEIVLAEEAQKRDGQLLSATSRRHGQAK